MNPELSAHPPVRIALLSLHGLVRGVDPELGRDSDTGGQVKYVLELARALGKRPEVAQVDLITRQILDDRVGPTYAAIQESLGEKARIVRLPFGPKRYLRKEALWPFLDLFVDQCLLYFRRNGMPDVIHGHYADAGYAGAQLSRLLHVPYVFTGHSLGRVKRERLLEQGEQSRSDLEQTFQFSARNEAEEIALETASLVITSTSQEVREQYELYEHYQPDRMEIIPPGVDLDRFCTSASDPVGKAVDDRADDPLVKSLHQFLREPHKPMILAIARPDAKKNFEALVHVYGRSKQLQSLANLVLIMGKRRDLREFPADQKRVLMNVLTLIDVYDLYGKVAYPKTHSPDSIPAIYRKAAASRGLFVNPAINEPFGLTLLEAAACGVPVVATQDGGPQDIVSNCQNGVLIDPNDHDQNEHALIRVLNSL